MSPAICDSLTLTASPKAAGEASAWLRALTQAYQLRTEWCDGMDLCVVELVANVCDYAYQGAEGVIRLSLRLSAHCAQLVIEDDGPPFDPLALAPPVKVTRLDEAQIGGYGVFLVRQFCDALEYERRDRSNCLTVTFGDAGKRPRGTDRRQSAASGHEQLPVERRRGTDRRSFGLISRAALFRDVAYDDLEPILSDCPLVALAANQVVLAAGQIAPSVWLVIEGTLRIHVDGPEKEHSFELNPDECFGEMSVADGQPASAWVVSATPCRLLQISADTFVNRLLTIPRIGRNLILILAERTRRHSQLTGERVRIETELKALQRELEFAQRIQASMLPASPMFIDEPRLDCCGFMRAARQVGGDFYDALPLDKHRYLVAIGDVCNKGMPAALFMTQTLAMLRNSALRALSDDEPSLAGMAAAGNDQLCQLNSEQLFVSIFLAVVDLEVDEIRYVNAGHNPPWLACPGAAPRQIDLPRNPVAGMVPGLVFKTGSAPFPEGSRLLLYTDGVTEAEASDTRQFGDEALAQLFIAGADRAGEMVRRVVAAVDGFANGHVQTDDVTLLCLHRR